MNKNSELIELIKKTNLNLNLEKISFEKLQTGKVNNSFLINNDEDNRKYILRINSPKSKKFNIIRKNEIIILNAIKEIKIAPKIIFSDPQFRFLITEYIDGYVCSKNNFSLNDRAILKKIIEKYQKIKVKLPKFNYLKHVKKYQKIIGRTSKIDNKLKSRLEKFYPYLENFQNQNWSPVLCHHDLNPTNIIKTDKGMKIIDWEFAGYGHSNYDFYCIGFKDKDDFFFNELISIINDLWVIIDNN
tara:strand:+ start:660 stop:1391 length:732 start_codon:yes stop_codon:yes gene_type:complete